MASVEQDSPDSGKSLPGNTSNVYEIQVRGILDDHWQQWFEGMTLRADASYDGGQGCTVIIGPLADQPALHGVLERIRDLNLALISIRRLPDGPKSPEESLAASQSESDRNGTA